MVFKCAVQKPIVLVAEDEMLDCLYYLSPWTTMTHFKSGFFWLYIKKIMGVKIINRKGIKIRSLQDDPA